MQSNSKYRPVFWKNGQVVSKLGNEKNAEVRRFLQKIIKVGRLKILDF